MSKSIMVCLASILALIACQARFHVKSHDQEKDVDTLASAHTVVLGKARTVHIAGTTTIYQLKSCNSANNGRKVTLVFDGTAELKDGLDIQLAGHFTGSAGRAIVLRCYDSKWLEVARSAP